MSVKRQRLIRVEVRRCVLKSPHQKRPQASILTPKVLTTKGSRVETLQDQRKSSVLCSPTCVPEVPLCVLSHVLQRTRGYNLQ